MGFFSKSSAEPAAASLPTTTAPAAAPAPAPEKESGGGIFFGMSLSEFLIAIGLLVLIFFFVLWPLITAYFFMACVWVLMWPFVKFIPACGNHKYVAPSYSVLSVAVWSPVKVTKFLYNTFRKDDPKSELKAEAAKQAAAAVTGTPSTATPAPQVMNKV